MGPDGAFRLRKVYRRYFYAKVDIIECLTGMGFEKGFLRRKRCGRGLQSKNEASIGSPHNSPHTHRASGGYMITATPAQLWRSRQPYTMGGGNWPGLLVSMGGVLFADAAQSRKSVYHIFEARSGSGCTAAVADKPGKAAQWCEHAGKTEVRISTYWNTRSPTRCPVRAASWEHVRASISPPSRRRTTVAEHMSKSGLLCRRAFYWSRAPPTPDAAAARLRTGAKAQDGRSSGKGRTFAAADHRAPTCRAALRRAAALDQSSGADETGEHESRLESENPTEHGAVRDCGRATPRRACAELVHPCRRAITDQARRSPAGWGCAEVKGTSASWLALVSAPVAASVWRRPAFGTGTAGEWDMMSMPSDMQSDKVWARDSGVTYSEEHTGAWALCASMCAYVRSSCAYEWEWARSRARPATSACARTGAREVVALARGTRSHIQTKSASSGGSGQVGAGERRHAGGHYPSTLPPARPSAGTSPPDPTPSWFNATAIRRAPQRLRLLSDKRHRAWYCDRRNTRGGKREARPGAEAHPRRSLELLRCVVDWDLGTRGWAPRAPTRYLVGICLNRKISGQWAVHAGRGEGGWGEAKKGKMDLVFIEMRMRAQPLAALLCARLYVSQNARPSPRLRSGEFGYRHGYQD
ncbi:hypothetical protein IEO21_02636 [Rhodonia placenta]|uniref:Uncharacterized protein n=1 Tax=Rhodonia placenta TaxID=104341 RepID=A0A8H7P7M7_9APHY|nr:hypothetical protein IEO21_02636 [Postia placenta]